MLARHPDIFKEDSTNCCYLCNECPQNFATLQQLQWHLSENHKVFPGLSSSANSEVIKESNFDVRNSFEKGNTLISKLDPNAETLRVYRNWDESEQKEEKQKAMFLESLQNCASTFPLIAENRMDKLDFRRENASCVNSPTTSDFSFTEPSGALSTQMEYDEEEEELDENCTIHGNVVDLPELKLGDSGSSPSNSAESVLKPNADVATQRRYACTKCERFFARRDELNIHYTHTHRERPRYTCDVCEQVFMVKRDLSTHARIHNGEQPQRCEICGKEYGTRQLLKKHSMVHTGVRSHFCPICPRAFYQKGHLTQHMHIHTGKRSHKCQLCVKTFIFKFDLNRHMKIHAERGGKSCRKCGKSFPKQSSLDEHFLKCKKRYDAKASGKHSLLSEHRQNQSLATPINPTEEKNDPNTFTSKLSPTQLLPNSPLNVDTKFFDRKVKPIPLPFSANWAFLNAQSASENLPLILNPRLQALQNLANLMISAAAARDGASKFNFSSLYNNSFVQNAANFAKLASFQQQQQIPPTTFAPNVTPPLLNFAQCLNAPIANENSSTQNIPTGGLNSLQHKTTLQQQLLHWSTLQLRKGILPQNQQERSAQTFNSDIPIKCKEHTESNTDSLNSALFLNTKLIQGFLKQSQNVEEFHCADSATTSSSSCASSPQKVSPVCYAAGNGNQPICEVDLRNQQHLPIVNSEAHCNMPQFPSDSTFRFETKYVTEKTKNYRSAELDVDHDPTLTSGIYVDDIVELDDLRLKEVVDVEGTYTKNANNEDRQNEKGMGQDTLTTAKSTLPYTVDGDTGAPGVQGRCSRCADVCTRECELERKLNAARDEIMRLRSAAQQYDVHFITKKNDCKDGLGVECKSDAGEMKFVN